MIQAQTPFTIAVVFIRSRRHAPASNLASRSRCRRNRYLPPCFHLDMPIFELGHPRRNLATRRAQIPVVTASSPQRARGCHVQGSL